MRPQCCRTHSTAYGPNMATEAPDVETLERGVVHVLYRPRVEHDEAHSVEDLQQLVLVLSTRDPDGTA